MLKYAKQSSLGKSSLGIGTLLLLTGSPLLGCRVTRRPAPVVVSDHVATHHVQASPTAHMNLAAPTTGFSTSISAAPVPQMQHTSFDPLQITPVPAPAMQYSAGELPLGAWNEFENPILLKLQSMADANAINDNNIRAKLAEDKRLGGGNSKDLVIHRTPRQTLRRRVAEAYADVRLNQQRLHSYHDNLKLQKGSVELAKLRQESGKAGRLELLDFENAVELTEARMAPVRDELRDSLKRLAVLTGQDLTRSMVQSIASQDQLSLPEVGESLPASILRGRCDVFTAEQSLIAIGSHQGVYEASVLPHLALQGELTARSDSAAKEPQEDMLGFDIGEKSTWKFADGGGTIPRGSSQGSPLRGALQQYESTVYAAASEVESLLTQYHRNVAEIRHLEQALENARDATRLTLQQFEADRTDGSHVVNSQGRRVAIGQVLAETRARLAKTAIALFLATSPECAAVNSSPSQ